MNERTFFFTFLKTGAHGGMILTGENRRTRRKTCPSDTLSTTNPTGSTWARTQAAAVRGRWLTPWNMAQLKSDYVETAHYDVVVVSVLLNLRVIICKTVLLDIVHRLNYKIIKLQRFQIWILLLSSDEEGGKRTESLSVRPPGWANLRPGPVFASVQILNHSITL
jgi:hypothetical protein